MQAHAKIKMITITPALSEDMKKAHSALPVAYASRTHLQISRVYCSAVFLLFLMIQFLFFHSCQLERLSDFEFLAGHREVSLGDMRQSLM